MHNLTLKADSKVLLSVNVNRIPKSKEELRALFTELARSLPQDQIVNVESEIIEKEESVQENL